MAAIISNNERGARREMSWPELKRQVAALALHLQAQGVQPGERVAAYLPNIAETMVAFLAVTSIGSLIGALATARLHLTTYKWVAGAALMLGVANIGMAIAPNVWVAFVWAIPLGAGGAAMIAGANSIITQEAPPDMRGRMLALTAVAFLGSTPIGGPITGWVADYVSVSWSLAYGGIITLFAAVFMFGWIWVKDIEHA
jgi:MFS family permease